MGKKASFSLAYSALKMFGKQLYSNVGSAISELVANGFDANASDVYVVIDARNKSSATIEILDNGEGMTPEHIQKNYVKNKRNLIGNTLAVREILVYNQGSVFSRRKKI